MAKGLRSNQKRALRTIRRNDSKVTSIYAKQEAERQARLQETVEAGKRAREKAEQDRKLLPQDDGMQGVERATNSGFNSVEKMEVDPLKPSSAKRTGFLMTKKKKLKQQRKKKLDGINQLHKKRKKGRRTKM